MQWLTISIVLSVVLTVVLNLVLRAFPRAGERATRSLDELGARAAQQDLEHDRRVRVYAPWKAMIVVSLGLTILLNVLIWIL